MSIFKHHGKDHNYIHNFYNFLHKFYTIFLELRLWHVWSMGLGILQRTKDVLMKVGRVAMEQNSLILLREQKGIQISGKEFKHVFWEPRLSLITLARGPPWANILQNMNSDSDLGILQNVLWVLKRLININLFQFSYTSDISYISHFRKFSSLFTMEDKALLC